MTDPWTVQNSGQKHISELSGKDNIEQPELTEKTTQQTFLEFEDNFAPAALATPSRERDKTNSNGSASAHKPLPDSDTYLRGLERKLQKIKKGDNLVEALAQKRNDCLHQLLRSGEPNNNNAVLALDQPLNNLEFYRHLQPVQALSVGELVHIVKYDQLHQEEAQESTDKEVKKEEEATGN